MEDEDDTMTDEQILDLLNNGRDTIKPMLIDHAIKALAEHANKNRYEIGIAIDSFQLMSVLGDGEFTPDQQQMIDNMKRWQALWLEVAEELGNTIKATVPPDVPPGSPNDSNATVADETLFNFSERFRANMTQAYHSGALPDNIHENTVARAVLILTAREYENDTTNHLLKNLKHFV